jgi:O-Antigen ligase
MNRFESINNAKAPFFQNELWPVAAGVILAGLIGTYLVGAIMSTSTKYAVGICLGMSCIGALIYFHRYVTQMAIFAFVVASGIAAQYRILTQKIPHYEGVVHYGGALPEPMISLVDLPLFLILGIAFYRIIIRRKPFPAWTGLDTCILLFLLTCSISFLKAPDLRLAFFELLQYCKYTMAYIALRILFDKEKFGRLIIFSWLIALVLEGIVSIAQYFFNFSLPFTVYSGFSGNTADTFSGGLNFIRVSGMTGYCNTFGTWLLFPLCICMTALFLNIKLRYKAIIVSFFFLGFFAMVITFSRAAWLAFLCSFIAMVSIMAIGGRLKNLHIQSIIVFTIFSIAAAQLSGFTHYIVVRVTTDNGAMQARPAFNELAMRMVKDFPFTGVGLNNFQTLSHYYDTDHITLNFDNVPHNVFMLFASETGIFCPIILIIMGMFLMKKSFSLIKDPRNGYNFFVGASCLACLVGIMVNQLFDNTLRNGLIVAQCTLLAALIMSTNSAVPASKKKPVY